MSQWKVVLWNLIFTQIFNSKLKALNKQDFNFIFFLQWYNYLKEHDFLFTLKWFLIWSWVVFADYIPIPALCLITWFITVFDQYWQPTVLYSIFIDCTFNCFDQSRLLPLNI